MAFELGGAINGAAEWFANAPVVRSVVSNPIFTALLITALAAVVVMALYHYQVKRAGLKRGLRAVLYVFLLVAAVTFVHHYAVARCARETAARRGVREVFSSIEQSRGAGLAAVPVVPLGYEPGPTRAAVGGAPGGPGAPAPASAQGGDCGCPHAGGRGAPAGQPAKGGPRPDNVALDAGLVIEDVVVPSAASPFGAE